VFVVATVGGSAGALAAAVASEVSWVAVDGPLWVLTAAAIGIEVAS